VVVVVVVAGTLKGKEDEEMKREVCHEKSNTGN
jgi:hypothetical protein